MSDGLQDMFLDFGYNLKLREKDRLEIGLIQKGSKECLKTI
jgi:hypothetical protein